MADWEEGGVADVGSRLYEDAHATEELDRDAGADGSAGHRFDAASAYKRDVQVGLVKLTVEGNEAGEGGGVDSVRIVGDDEETEQE